MPTIYDAMGQILPILKSLRFAHSDSEYALHRRIAKALNDADIPFHLEVPIGKRCRIDFLCQLAHFGVGIEIKRGKRPSAQVIAQIERYSASEKVDAIFLVVDRNIFRLPTTTSNGKPIEYISLSKNWGIAL